MSVPLVIWILAACAELDPDHDHTEIAESIARVVAASEPLEPNDPDRIKTASDVVAVAWREGRLQAHGVIGDSSRSFCTMQIHTSGGGTRDLIENVDKCIATGLEMLRVSRRIDPAHPVAFYARGPRGYQTKRARELSGDRVALAKYLRIVVKP